MSLSSVFRRSLAGAAASIAMATGAAVVQAQAPAQAPANQNSVMFAATLNEVCLPFNDTKRRTKKYDEPLGLLADKIKSFSGWAEIEAGMKAAGQAFEGLCPSTKAEGAIVAMPSLRGFAINIRDPRTNKGVDPALFTEKVIAGNMDPLANNVVMIGSTLSLERANEPLLEVGRDLETLILLNTVQAAHLEATSMALLIEQAVKDDNSEKMKMVYSLQPQYVALLSDYHAVAIAAKRQNRDITDQERHTLRDKLTGVMLKDPEMRGKHARVLVMALAQENLDKAVSDLSTNQSFTPVEVTPYEAAYIEGRLSRFPGNLADSDAVKNYRNYWQQQREANQDPLAEGEQYLNTLLDKIKTNENVLKEQVKKNPGMRLRLE